MAENNWKRLWSGRTAEESILRGGSPEQVFMELKRADGFDVVEGGISYASFLEQYHEMRKHLSLRLPAGGGIKSVYEVGCGSGANLFLLERDGIACGGIDYSPTLSACARQVLRTEDIRCAHAEELPIEPRYDAVISVSVFGYFTGGDYAECVLERMCEKAAYSVGVLELADLEKKDAFTAYRKRLIPNYEERYQGLPRQFYSKEFFRSFAHRHGMEALIVPVTMHDYWNSEFYYDCYLYKH